MAGIGVTPETLHEITQRLGLMRVAEEDFVEPLARFIAGRGGTRASPQGFSHPTLKALCPDPSSCLALEQAGAATQLGRTAAGEAATRAVRLHFGKARTRRT